jgi:hypothetical protein
MTQPRLTSTKAAAESCRKQQQQQQQQQQASFWCGLDLFLYFV